MFKYGYKSLVWYIVQNLQDTYNIDIRNDAVIMQRVKNASKQAIHQCTQNSSVRLSIPNIAYSNKKPLNVYYDLDKYDLKNIRRKYRKSVEFSALKPYLLKSICIIGIIVVIIFLIQLYRWNEYQVLEQVPEGGATFVCKLKEVDLIQNDSVGNDWSFTGTISGKNVNEGDTAKFYLATDGKLILSAKAIENDSIPDIGTNKMTVSFNSIAYSKNETYSIDVKVRENRGRYTGHLAIWRFNFDISRKITVGMVIDKLLNDN